MLRTVLKVILSFVLIINIQEMPGELKTGSVQPCTLASPPGLSRGAGLESGGGGTSSLHRGVGLGQNPRAEPYELPEDSSQTRPPCTLATSLCVFFFQLRFLTC